MFTPAQHSSAKNILERLLQWLVLNIIVGWINNTFFVDFCEILTGFAVDKHINRLLNEIRCKFSSYTVNPIILFICNIHLFCSRSEIVTPRRNPPRQSRHSTGQSPLTRSQRKIIGVDLDGGLEDDQETKRMVFRT